MLAINEIKEKVNQTNLSTLEVYTSTSQTLITGDESLK